MIFEERIPNERLRRARHCKGWTQSQLAEALGTDFETVSRWERGIMVPSAHYQNQLCKVLGQTADELGFIASETELLPAVPSPYVFLASSYADAENETVTQLRADLQARGIRLWTSRQVRRQGADQRRTLLQEAIRTAQVTLLIVSPEARSSRHVQEALQLAGVYQRRVCGVWIGGRLWQECLPKEGVELSGVIDARAGLNPSLLNELVAKLEAFRLEASRMSTVTSVTRETIAFPCEPRNPYKGLFAFHQEDASDFFGRANLIDELLVSLRASLLAEQENGQSARLLAVVGPSGSGKSSVVMAGLLPRLLAGGLPGSQEWVYLDPITPGIHPLESLALTLSQKLSHTNLETIRTSLQSDSANGLHTLVAALTKQQSTKVVLIVDQFEEIFTLTSSQDERDHFLALLLNALTEPDGPIMLLLTLRADLADRLMHYPELYRLIDVHHCSVLPMDLEDLRAVIEQPAALPDVQLIFENDLVGDLLFEMQGQVGALPLLEFTLDQLFRLRDAQTLTMTAYHQIGGVKGALAKYAESTYIALPTEEHRKIARTLFLRLIDPGLTEQDTTRRRAALSELVLPDPKETHLLEEVVEVFIHARLLTTNALAATSTIEVSHEALIREWKRLWEWLREAREDIRLQKTISDDVAEWIRRGRPNDRLYRGTQLTEAQAWAERTTPSIDEVAFLQASATHREREQTERTLQQRELGLQRLAARRLRYLSSMTLVTAVVLAVGLLVSLVFYAQLQVSLPASVTNLSDHGPGSLREAIKKASPGSTISFARNLQGTISLTSGELVINKNLIIAGPGSNLLSISGSRVSRVFTIQEGVTVAIFGVTITKGRTIDTGGGILNNGELTVTDSTVSGCTSIKGGGIDNHGVLTLTESTISDNRAELDNAEGGGFGGGIFNYDGTLNIIRSTVSHNSALRAGGGIDDGYTLSLETSTIAYNTAEDRGGGINVGDGGQASIFASTIYGNTARKFGGNMYTYTAPIKLHANIIADGNARQGKDISGTVTSFAHGYNLIGTLDGTTLTDDSSTPIYLTGSPRVGPLQDNGGPTQTMALLPGSSAIDFIPFNDNYVDSNGCRRTIDQRGMPRPDGKVPACDIGAYESSGLSSTTAQAKANAAAEALADTSPIAYPPHNQSPVLTDPLQDNSKGNGWEEDTSGGDCKFIHRAYDIKTNQQEWCAATSTGFTNFIYEVQMKIVTGGGGGILFCINPDPKANGEQYHSFTINQDGSYSIQASNIVLASGSSPAIHRGLNQTNLVAAAVHGQIIELYVNLQRIAVVSTVVGSRTPTHGQIGVIVTPSPSGQQTEVIFQNAKVWTI